MFADIVMNLETLTITEDILFIIAELDEFKGAWRALGRLAPERLSALLHVATIESIGSSTRIEGAKLSDREVEKLLSKLKINSFRTRDEQEVAGYSDVIETVFMNWKNIVLSENHIRQLHNDLLKYSDKDERHRGDYKKLNNHVEAFDETGKSIGIIFQTATPFDTPRLMTELVEWTNTALEENHHHSLITIAVFIVTFLQIHPFQDGNGRLSRILTTLLLLRAGYLYVPYSSLESVIEQNKESYYLALRRTQGTIQSEAPDWEPWILFFLRALQQQKRKLEVKVEKENLMQKRLPELSLQILDTIRSHGRTTLSAAVAATSGNRNTVKRHLQNLVAEGYLLKQGRGKATWYILA
jgi:Fic family protein